MVARDHLWQGYQRQLKALIPPPLRRIMTKEVDLMPKKSALNGGDAKAINDNIHPEDKTRKEELDRLRGMRPVYDPERGPSNPK